MLQALKQTSLEQLWVTTRPHLKEELEDNLQQLSYTLEPFFEDDQVEFLKKFWFQTSDLEDKGQQRLNIFAITLIRNLSQSISDKDKEFTGIPLQTRMIAEAFEKEFISFYFSEKSEPELPHRIDLVGLYRQFIDTKCDIYYKEKCKMPAGNLVAERYREREFKIIQKEHRWLALEVIFTEDQVTFLQSYDQSTFSDEEIAMIGIAQRNKEGKLHFIHRTFAEYFVAEFLMNELVKETKQNTQMLDFLLSEILLRTEYLVIRAFFDGLLGKNQQTIQALKDYGEKLNEQWHKREVHKSTTALHQAAAEDNANIVEFIFDSLVSAGRLKTLRDMVFAEDDKGKDTYDLATENMSIQAIKKITEWVKRLTSTSTQC
jgi:hypothetical protein